MNPLLLIALLATLALASGAAIAAPDSGASTATDRLTFLNGDRIRGQLHGADAAGNLLWSLRPGEPSILIPSATVHKIVLASNPAPTPKDQDISLSLSNGDSLHGKLIALGKESIELESPAFSRLRVPREMISGLNVNDGGYYLLAEPGPAKEWFVDNRGSWKVLNGVLRASDYGVLGRGLPKASRIRIDFDVRTEDSGTGFTLHMFASNPKEPAKEANYAIQFSGAYVYARKTVASQEGVGIFGRAGGFATETLGEPQRLDRPLGTRSARVTVLGDARAGRLILQIDGKSVQTWNDPRGLGDKHGSAIGFASNTQSTVITNLTVARWNGAIEGQTEPAATVTSATDSIFLANDDLLTGKVIGLADGAVNIEADHFGSIALPTSRILRVQLASTTLEQARRLSGDVLARFRGGGQLTLRMESLDAGLLAGFSENCGHATIPLPNIRELVFNLYSEKFPDPETIAEQGPDTLLDGGW